MREEGRTLAGYGHGTSLLQEETKIAPPRQVTATPHIRRCLPTDNTHKHK